jgi:aquaporin Z
MDERLEAPQAALERESNALRILREHWPEYLMEAAGLGLFMVSACAFTVLLHHPESPAVRIVPDATLRRGLTGVAMGLTAIAIVYSPWGKRSGAHLNPALTLTFLRLGKVRPLDALFYVLAQFVGGIMGVVLAALLLGPPVAAPAVNYAVTRPGPGGALVAFAAEALISFGLVSVILRASAHKILGRYTGLIAGAIVATYILLEAPLSGMSMNPARTLGSAVAAHAWQDLWIYFTAPPLGMLLAGEVYRWTHGGQYRGCAKFHHQNPSRCIFCAYQRQVQTAGKSVGTIQ